MCVSAASFKSFSSLERFSALKIDLQPVVHMLATEIYKALNGLSPDIMQDIFETKSNYCDTRNVPARNTETVRYGLQTISYMAPKIWDFAPKEKKRVTALNEFKGKINIWKLKNCPCPADSVEHAFRR